ncbi:hypothetical protein IGI37_000324 [Enterococcus sp. AZ194]|uniref:hypothetical protein n=1 Tax=Enterococcus sp. AZ194 TaxID=2774629 RepID=UPI003F294639
MKSKLMITSLLIICSLSGCGIKKTINEAHEVVQKENTENAVNQEPFADEDPSNAESLPIDSNAYIKQQQNADTVDYSKTVVGDFIEHEIRHAKEHVIESFSTAADSVHPTAYSIEVSNQSKKTNNKLSNKDLAINLFSNFLQEAQVIDKPLDMIIDLDVTDYNQYPLTDTHTLVVSPQPDTDGFILQLGISFSTD